MYQGSHLRSPGLGSRRPAEPVTRTLERMMDERKPWWFQLRLAKTTTILVIINVFYLYRPAVPEWVQCSEEPSGEAKKWDDKKQLRISPANCVSLFKKKRLIKIVLIAFRTHVDVVQRSLWLGGNDTKVDAHLYNPNIIISEFLSYFDERLSIMTVDLYCRATALIRILIHHYS